MVLIIFICVEEFALLSYGEIEIWTLKSVHVMFTDILDTKYSDFFIFNPNVWLP
jgi:hypothetical protein